MTRPMMLMPPNFCSLAASSIYTLPEINAATAGSKMLPTPGSSAQLKVAIVTSTK